MGKRDEVVFLEDMLGCINKITKYTQDISELEFEQNTEKQDAVIRRIETRGYIWIGNLNSCYHPAAYLSVFGKKMGSSICPYVCGWLF